MVSCCPRLSPSGRKLQDLFCLHWCFPEGLQLHLANLLRRTLWCSDNYPKPQKAQKPSTYWVTIELTAQSAVPVLSEDMGLLLTSTQTESWRSACTNCRYITPWPSQRIISPFFFSTIFTGKTKIIATEAISLTIRPAAASLKKKTQNHVKWCIFTIQVSPSDVPAKGNLKIHLLKMITCAQPSVLLVVSALWWPALP